MRNLKEDAVFFCGVDGKMLALVQGKYSIYYRCPNYEYENRKAGEDVCMNRLSLKDAETLYEELQKIEQEKGISIGDAGKKIHLVYEVADVNPSYIKVYVINTKKIHLDGGGYELSS